MVFTDWGFSVIRDWVLGKEIGGPMGMLVGTGSNPPSFGDLRLGSPLDPTFHGFASVSGIGTMAQLEHFVRSGDITTGSIIREIGMVAEAGGNVFFRSLIPETELFGSVEVDSFLLVSVI